MPRKKGSKNAPKTVQKKTVAKETKHLLSPENIDDKIVEMNSEIKDLNGKIKEKKLQLKALEKAKAVAEKEAAKKKAEADREALLAAIEASGKSVDEIMQMLKK